MPGDENANVPGDENANVPGDENADVPGDENANVPGDENADVPGDENADVPGVENVDTSVDENADTSVDENANVTDENADTTGENADTPSDENTDTPADENTDTPADENTDTPVDENTDTPADENADTPADENAGAPVDENTDTPADENTDTSADENTDTSVDENTDTPADENADTPADENTDTSINENTDTPTDENTDTSTDENIDTPTDENTDTPTEENTDTPADENADADLTGDDGADLTGDDGADLTDDLTDDGADLTGGEDQAAPVEEEAPAAPFDQSALVNGVIITVKADAGVFPADAVLSVELVPVEVEQLADEAIGEVRDADANVAISYTFDIKVINPATGEEYQPVDGQTVNVSFSLEEVADENLETQVYHVTEDEDADALVAEKLDVAVEDAVTATVETDGFSLYTVEFTYNKLEYVLPGDTSVALSEILSAVGLSGEVTAVEISNTGLFSAAVENGEWIVTAHQAFTTTEWMKVTISEVTYEIVVTDDPEGNPGDGQGGGNNNQPVDNGTYRISVNGGQQGGASLFVGDTWVSSANANDTVKIRYDGGTIGATVTDGSGNSLVLTPLTNDPQNCSVSFIMPASNVSIALEFGGSQGGGNNNQPVDNGTYRISVNGGQQGGASLFVGDTWVSSANANDTVKIRYDGGTIGATVTDGSGNSLYLTPLTNDPQNCSVSFIMPASNVNIALEFGGSQSGNESSYVIRNYSQYDGEWHEGMTPILATRTFVNGVETNRAIKGATVTVQVSVDTTKINFQGLYAYEIEDESSGINSNINTPVNLVDEGNLTYTFTMPNSYVGFLLNYSPIGSGQGEETARFRLEINGGDLGNVTISGDGVTAPSGEDVYYSAPVDTVVTVTVTPQNGNRVDVGRCQYYQGGRWRYFEGSGPESYSDTQKVFTFTKGSGEETVLINFAQPASAVVLNDKYLSHAASISVSVEGNVQDNTDNWTYAADDGDEVSITVTPEDGYALLSGGIEAPKRDDMGYVCFDENGNNCYTTAQTFTFTKGSETARVNITLVPASPTVTLKVGDTVTKTYTRSANGGMFGVERGYHTFTFPADSDVVTALNEGHKLEWSDGDIYAKHYEGDTWTLDSDSATFTYTASWASTYTVTCTSTAQGTIASDWTAAASGEKVYFTVTPALGNTLKLIHVTAQDGTTIWSEYRNNADMGFWGRHLSYFEMPAQPVTITAEYNEESSSQSPTVKVSGYNTDWGSVSLSVGGEPLSATRDDYGNYLYSVDTDTEVTVTVTPTHGCSLLSRDLYLQRGNSYKYFSYNPDAVYTGQQTFTFTKDANYTELIVGFSPPATSVLVNRMGCSENGEVYVYADNDGDGTAERLTETDLGYVVNTGEVVTIETVADRGYMLDETDYATNVSLGGQSLPIVYENTFSGNTRRFTFTKGSEPTFVNVSFQPDSRAIYVRNNSPEEYGTISVTIGTGEATVDPDDIYLAENDQRVVITATPNAGYRVSENSVVYLEPNKQFVLAENAHETAPRTAEFVKTDGGVSADVWFEEADTGISVTDYDMSRWGDVTVKVKPQGATEAVERSWANPGDEVIVTFTPKDGCRADFWSCYAYQNGYETHFEDTDSMDPSAPVTLTFTKRSGHTRVYARFVPPASTLRLRSNLRSNLENGLSGVTVKVNDQAQSPANDGIYTVSNKASVTIEVTPPEGYCLLSEGISHRLYDSGRHWWFEDGQANIYTHTDNAVYTFTKENDVTDVEITYVSDDVPSVEMTYNNKVTYNRDDNPIMFGIHDGYHTFTIPEDTGFAGVPSGEKLRWHHPEGTDYHFEKEVAVLPPDNKLELVAESLSPYSVTIANGIVNGEVTRDKATAVAGEKVILTVTPDFGYKENGVTVTSGSGPVGCNEYHDGTNNDGTYKRYEFTMPEGAVTVSAAFMEATDYNGDRPTVVHVYNETPEWGSVSLTVEGNTPEMENEWSTNDYIVPSGKEVLVAVTANDGYSVGPKGVSIRRGESTKYLEDQGQNTFKFTKDDKYVELHVKLSPPDTSVVVNIGNDIYGGTVYFNGQLQSETNKEYTGIESGSMNTIRAVPKPGYCVRPWGIEVTSGGETQRLDDGDGFYTDEQTLTFEKGDEYASVLVGFEMLPEAVCFYIDSEEGGTVTYAVDNGASANAVDGSIFTVDTGKTVTVTIAPKEGYCIDPENSFYRQYDDIRGEYDTHYAMSEVTGTLTLTFEKNRHSTFFHVRFKRPSSAIVIHNRTPQWGSVTSDHVTASEGENVTITATPNAGCHVEGFFVQCDSWRQDYEWYQNPGPNGERTLTFRKGWECAEVFVDFAPAADGVIVKTENGQADISVKVTHNGVDKTASGEGAVGIEAVTGDAVEITVTPGEDFCLLPGAFKMREADGVEQYADGDEVPNSSARTFSFTKGAETAYVYVRVENNGAPRVTITDYDANGNAQTKVYSQAKAADAAMFKQEHGGWTFTLPEYPFGTVAAGKTVVYNREYYQTENHRPGAEVFLDYYQPKFIATVADCCTISIPTFDHGTVTAEPEKPIAGEMVKLTVMPEESYAVDSVTATYGDSPLSVWSNYDENDQRYYYFYTPYALTGSDITVNAVFSRPKFGIDAYRYGDAATDRYLNITATVNGESVYQAEQGETVTVSIAKGAKTVVNGLTAEMRYYDYASGFVTEPVTLTAVAGSDGTAYTFTMPGGNVYLEPDYAYIGDYTITIHTDGHGTVIGNCVDECSRFTENTADAGSRVELIATPDAGYRIKSYAVVSDNDWEIEVNEPYDDFTMPGANVTVTATFESTANPPEGGVAIDATNFPDDTFRAYVTSEFDGDSDGYLSRREIVRAWEIDVSGKAITTMEGLEFFTDLDTLECSGCGLASLDVSKNINLRNLRAYDNSLTALDVSASEDLVRALSVPCTGNPDWIPDTAVVYGYEWNLAVDKIVMLTPAPPSDAKVVQINETNFPDATFRMVVSIYDLDHDGWLSEREIFPVTRIELSTYNGHDSIPMGVSNLKGIEYFKNLMYLDCSDNNLTTLDVHANAKLRELHCDNNALEALTVTGCTALEELTCENNPITSLNVAGFTALVKLDCENNALTSLDVRGCTALEELDCSGNGDAEGENTLTTLLIVDTANGGAANLKSLHCDDNAITSLDVSGCTALEELDCCENQLTELTVVGCAKLEELDCSYNALPGLDVTGCTALKYLYCYDNALTTLNFTGCTALVELDCCDNLLSGTLDVSDCAAMEDLNCSDNRDKDGNSGFTGIVLFADNDGNNANLKYLHCSNNRISSLSVSKCSALRVLNCNDNALKSLDVSGCTALAYLYCGDNNGLATLTLPSNGDALETLHCYTGSLTSLDVSNCPNLLKLDCSGNQLRTLYLLKNTALNYLHCEYNYLTTLDIWNCPVASYYKATPDYIRVDPENRNHESYQYDLLDYEDWTDYSLSIDKDVVVHTQQNYFNALPKAVLELTYNGQSQALVTAGEVPDGHIEYSTDGGNNWSTDIPQKTDAGTYSVYYKVTGLYNHEDVVGQAPIEVTIAKLPVTVTITGASATTVYNGQSHTVTGYTAVASSTLYDVEGNDKYFTFSGNETATRTDAGTTSMGLAEAQFANKNANFAVTFTVTDGSQTVTKAKLTVVAASQSKVYGTDDPDLTYTGAENLPDGVTLTGELARATGEDVKLGGYAIRQGTLALTTDAAKNYDLLFKGARLTITPAPLTVTVEAGQKKTYGEDDPTLTYAVTGLTNNDTKESVLTGALSREAGETVKAGGYAITQGTLALTDYGEKNYTLVYDENNANAVFNIAKKTVTVTAENKTKAYGDDDPALTYTVTGLVGNDSLISGKLSRTAGENVDTYTISEDENNKFAAGDNYTISVTSGTLTIRQRPLTVVAQAKTLTQSSNDDPNLDYTSVGLAIGDRITSTLQCVYDKEVVKDYPITMDPITVVNGNNVNVTENYNIGFVGANLTISAKPVITVTADPNQSKTYGEADPELKFKHNGPEGLGFTGKLGRVGGDAVGEYAITLGDLSADGYAIQFVPNMLTITPAPLTVTVDAGQTKIYGDADPELRYTVSGLTNDDDESVFTGALSRKAGENAGEYEIEEGTLSAGSNYSMNFVKSTLTIQPKTLTITPDNQTKTYGQNDPELTFTVSGLVKGDTQGSVLNDGKLGYEGNDDAGEHKITLGSLALTSGNYALSLQDATMTIEPKEVTLEIIENTCKKEYRSDVAENIQYTLPPELSELQVTGTLTREQGESVGAYAIDASALKGNESDNYVFKVKDNKKFTITPVTIGLGDWENTTPYYNGYRQKPTVTVSGLKQGDSCSVIVSVKEPDENKELVLSEGIDARNDYIAEAVELDNQNYKLPEDVNDRRHSFTIQQATKEPQIVDRTVTVSFNGVEKGKLDLSAYLNDATGWRVTDKDGIVTDAFFEKDAKDNDTPILIYNTKDVRWVNENTGTVTISVESNNYHDYDLTVNFKTSSAFTLEFDTAGGPLETSRMVREGDSIKDYLPTATRAGYDKVEWFVDAAKTEPVTANTQMGASSTTVYAKWTPTAYTVTLDPGEYGTLPAGCDATFTYDVETDPADAKLTLPRLINDESLGSVKVIFIGWKEKSQLEDATVEPQLEVTIDPQAIDSQTEKFVTYVGQWKLGEVGGKVSFQPDNEGNSGLMGLVGMANNEADTEDENLPTTGLANAMRSVASQQDDVKSDDADSKVIVEMKISASGSDDSAKREIQEKLKSKGDQDTEYMTDYMDITITSTTSIAGDTPQNDIEIDRREVSVLDHVVEIPLRYDLTGRYNLKIWRFHTDEETGETKSEELTRLNYRPKGTQIQENDCRFYVEGSGQNAIIYIYSKKFCTMIPAYDNSGVKQVYFDYNDNTNKVDEVNVQKGEKFEDYKLADPEPVTEGNYIRVFTGWYENQSCEEKYRCQPDKDDYSNNARFYAGWKKLAIEKMVVNNVTHDYNGQKHEVSVTPENENKGVNIRVLYSTDGQNGYSADLPGATEPGTYTFYWKAIGDNCVPEPASGTVTLVIEKLTPNVTAPTAKSPTYNGKAQVLVNPGKTDGGTLQYAVDTKGTSAPTAASEWSDIVPSRTNAGDYYVWFRVVNDAHYKDAAEKSVKVVIKKGTTSASSLTASQKPSARSGLTATGAAIALVNKPTALPSGYTTVLYSTDGVKYSTGIPTATAAGTYKVWTKYSGNPNCDDLIIGPMTVTIAKAAAPATPATPPKGDPTPDRAEAGETPSTPTTPTTDTPSTPSTPTTPTTDTPTTPTTDTPTTPTTPTTDTPTTPTTPTTDTPTTPTTPTDDTPSTPTTPTDETPSTPTTPTDDTPETTPDEGPIPIEVLKKSVKAKAEVGKTYQIVLGDKVGKKFKSSKKKVATVTSTGLITPLKAGKTKITFKVGKKKRTLTLTVTDPTIPPYITLNHTGTVTLKKGETLDLEVTFPKGTESGIKWTSSNKKVATVVNGVVTCKKKGKTTITATCTKGKKKAKVKIVVTN